MQKRNAGMTLMELIVAVVIVGILSAIAVTSYQTRVKRSRRVDAIQTLLAIQLAQENYRSNNAQYGTLAQVWGGVTSTSNGYYTLAISNVSATGYTLTATAASVQVGDSENGTSCASLVLTMSNGTEAKTPGACWMAS